jgi:transcriptional regulator of acetoin/glycerol metabolism
VLCDGPEIQIEHLPAPGGGARRAPEPARLTPEQEAERRRMLAALEEHAWNQSAAARALGMPRRTFVSKIALYDLPRPRSERG